MAIHLSTALYDSALTAMQTAMAYGKIEIRTGTRPASADAAITGTLLGIATVNHLEFTPDTLDGSSNGINFDAPVDRTLAKAAGETWEFVGLANGQASYGVMYANPTDDGTARTDLARITFSIGVTGSSADMTLSSTSIKTGTTNTITEFSVYFPTP